MFWNKYIWKCTETNLPFFFFFFFFWQLKSVFLGTWKKKKNNSNRQSCASTKLSARSSSRTDLRLFPCGRTAKKQPAVRASCFRLWPYRRLLQGASAIHLHSPDLCPAHTLPQGAAIWLPASACAQEKGSEQWRRGPCGLLCPLSIKALAKGRGQKQPRGASEQMEQVDQAVGDY